MAKLQYPLVAPAMKTTAAGSDRLGEFRGLGGIERHLPLGARSGGHDAFVGAVHDGGPAEVAGLVEPSIRPIGPGKYGFAGC